MKHTHLKSKFTVAPARLVWQTAAPGEGGSDTPPPTPPITPTPEQVAALATAADVAKKAGEAGTTEQAASGAAVEGTLNGELAAATPDKPAELGPDGKPKTPAAKPDGTVAVEGAVIAGSSVAASAGFDKIGDWASKLGDALEKFFNKFMEWMDTAGDSIAKMFGIKTKEKQEVTKAFSGHPLGDEILATASSYDSATNLLSFTGQKGHDVHAVESGTITKIEGNVVELKVEDAKSPLNGSIVRYENVTVAGLTVNGKVTGGDKLGTVGDTGTLTLGMTDANGAKLNPEEFTKGYIQRKTDQAAAAKAAEDAKKAATAPTDAPK